MVQPDLEDLLASSYWVCDKCEASFATKELAEKHELKCYVFEDIKEDVESLEKMLEKTENVLNKSFPHFFYWKDFSYFLHIFPTFVFEKNEIANMSEKI